MRLEGRIALVTGGASGVGAATCRRLAGGGAPGGGTGMNPRGAHDVASQLDGAAFELNVTSTDSIGAAVSAVEDELGPVDILINNAGYDEFGFFVKSEEPMWDRVLGVNLRGVIAVTHAVLPGMQERRRGRIVNVASEAGRVGSSRPAGYSAAKGGGVRLPKGGGGGGARR